MIPKLRTRTLVHRDPSALIVELYGELKQLRDDAKKHGQLTLPMK